MEKEKLLCVIGPNLVWLILVGAWVQTNRARLRRGIGATESPAPCTALARAVRVLGFRVLATDLPTPTGDTHPRGGVDLA
jgi:hypothetical protein